MSNATSTFSVAIAGFGWWGRHIATRLQDHPWLRVAGVVEPVVAGAVGAGVVAADGVLEEHLGTGHRPRRIVAGRRLVEAARGPV